MAKAKLLEHKERVKLSLTEKEAHFLRDVLMRIGGSPERSPRLHANSIRRALEDVGIRGTYADCTVNGSISYADGNL